MDTMNVIAMWVGLVVMAAGALAAVAFVLGLVATYAWRKLLRDVPSFLYVQHAVAVYRKTYPPSRWAREQLGREWPKPRT